MTNNLNFFDEQIGAVRVSSDKTPYVNATPTERNLRISGATAKLMGVDYKKVGNKDKDKGLYIMLGKMTVEGEKVLAIRLADPATFPEGEVPNSAAKLGAPAKTGGACTFSNSGMYQALDGDGVQNTRWKVTSALVVNEEGTALVAVALDEIPAGSTPFFVVTFVDRQANTKKKKGETTLVEDLEANNGGSVDGADLTPGTDTAVVVEEATETQGEGSDDDLFE
ncbi:MAG: hypothetical protein COA82_03425 [Alkaliphilus sp.]|nr:MAG: hypothetical protein COA82_03425 [Alkaliphilus sp.]